MDYGDGFYYAPGMPHLQLVVGKTLIDVCFRDFPRMASAAKTDMLGRHVLSLVAHENNIEKIKRVHRRFRLLDEQWNGERI